MTLELDRRLMQRALREGRRGRPSPNPHVGAVIAREGLVVGLGHHERAGEAHAEVNAIRAAGDAARGATLYCTLEPCNHFGRTPPCTDAIVAAGLARVVIGCADPKPHVEGAVGKLRAAGIEVALGVCEDDARALVADFARHRLHGLPYATLKSAVTLDGRTATQSGDSKWITGERARKHAHRLRDRSDAVLVGVGTVLADDPALTVRHVRGRDPIRVVLDTHLRTPAQARVVRGDSAAPAWIVHGPSAPPASRAALRDAGAELVEVELEGERVALAPALRELARRGVVRLLVEGGAQVHGAMLAQGLASEAAIFVAPLVLGDPRAIPLADGETVGRISGAWRLEPARIVRLGSDVLFAGPLVRG